MPDYPNNNFAERAWNRVRNVRQSIGSLFPSKPITVARNVSTGNRVHIPDTRDDAQVYRHEKNNDAAHLSHREQRQAYERHMEKFAHKSEGKYDSAISHTGAVREATTGRMFNRVNSEEKMAKGYDDIDKKRLHKSIREGGMSKEYRQAIKPPAQSM